MSQQLKNSLENLIQVVKNDPNLGKATFETTTTLKEGVSVETQVRHFILKADEPEVTGGKDTASNPLEYLVASLGACQAITYKALASLKGIQLKGLEVKVKAYTDLNGFLGLDSSVRPGFLKVEFETIIESDENPRRLKALAEQVELLCPVLDIFANTTDVNGKLIIEKTKELVA